MARTATRIIKKGSMKEGGLVRLGFGGGSAAGQMPARVPAGNDFMPQQARVVASDEESVLIEVCCSCGQKFYLRCNYNEMQQKV